MQHRHGYASAETCPCLGSSPPRAGVLWLVAAVLALLPVGCSTKHYRKSADKEVYSAISVKGTQVVNMDNQFTIEQTNALSLAGLPIHTRVEPFLGIAAEAEQGAVVLGLERALAIGVKQSRVYQNTKEQLYLAALSFTLARHQFAPLFSGVGRADYAVQTESFIRYEIDEITGEPRPVVSDQLVERNLVSGNGALGVNWLIRDIGRITAAFTTDFTRFLTGDPRTVANSQLGATFTRPLLRNAGFKQEVENLTQSERNLLYQVREFVRFRKTFTVQIARDYYGVLSGRDATRNAFLRFESAKRNSEQTRALAEEGRRPQGDLGRLQTDELNAEASWIDAVRRYRRSLDDFKIVLGIPVETNLILDDQELAALRILHPTIKTDDAIKVALEARLDFQNERDRFDDAKRQVSLAADSLKTHVDLAASGSISSPPDVSSGFPVPDPERYRWNAGFLVDLPLERKAERNNYRQALIAQDRAARSLAQRHDEIVLEVRESWRTLEQARRTYEIAVAGVTLAERRAEEQEVLAELGRGRAQDQVDAETALLQSRDARTQALVSHTIARLQFWENLGILYIKPDGQWEEVTHGEGQ